ncbi:MAG TPA: hypothetical protein VIP98_02570 [Microlunatus sp.]
MSESADGPEGLGGEPSGPDFAGPDYQPPVGQQRPTEVPAADDFAGRPTSRPDAPAWPPPSGSAADHETWPVAAEYGVEPTPRRGRATLGVITVAVALCLILIATVVVLVQRLVVADLPTIRQTTPATSSATPTVSVPATPADDAVGRALTGLGMTCVREYEHPVLNTCRTRPGESYGEVSWAADDGLVAFRMYHRAKSAADREGLDDQLRQLGQGGLPPAARDKINTAMIKAKKKQTSVAIKVDWGKIIVEYYATVGGFQIDGSKAGSQRVSVPGRPFIAEEASLIKVLSGRAYDCSPGPYELNCKDATGSIQVYRYDRSEAYYYLDLRDTSGRPQLMDALLPVLLRPADLDVVRSMINANEGSDYFLGAAGGYLIEITSDTITVETVSW